VRREPEREELAAIQPWRVLPTATPTAAPNRTSAHGCRMLRQCRALPSG